MAAITATQRAELVALFLTMFGEAPTTVQLARMVTARENGNSLVSIATAAAAELEEQFALVASMDADAFANYLAGALLAADTPAAAREWAIDWVVTNVQGSMSKIQVIAAAVSELLATPNPAFASSQAQLEAAVESALDPIDNPPVSGQSLVLTTGADALTGNNGNDTFVATEATLSSADLLNGGNGTDTLRYASSGNAAVNEAGFETTNIEIAQVTADAVGGTLFDTTGMTGLTTLRNSNSSEDLTLAGMSSLVAVELVNIGSAGALANDPTPDTTLVFNAATVAGAADAVSVTLNGNLNVDGSGVGTLTANGIETFNVTSTGGASRIDTIASGSVEAINVSGDANLTIDNNLVGAETINASAFTGNLSVVVDSGAIDVVVTGGAGNDRADFSNGWDTGDKFDGGAGTDTLALTYAVASGIGAASGSASNVEVLDVTTVAGATGAVDMDNFAGVTKVILNAGITTGVTATVDDAVSGLEVELDMDGGANGTLYVDLKTDGSSDALTVTLDNIDAGETIASINVEDAETVNLSADDDTTDGTGAVTITSLNLTDAATLNLSGDADITITASVTAATPALATINASAATGNVSISGTNTSASGATITLGSGNDTITFATSSGADTITLGAGKDTLVYNAVAQSDSDLDTVTDFVSGTDKLSFNFANPVLNFRGNQPSFGLAQGSLTAGNTPAGGLDAVYQVDDQILWIDIDDNGTLDNNDFRIKLSGVASLTTADLGLLASGNTVKLSDTTASAVNTTDKGTASAVTTNFNDAISGKLAIAENAASVINGGLGTDTLTLTTAGDFTPHAGLISIEALVLATEGTTANSVEAFHDDNVFASITGSSNVDVIDDTSDLIEGGTISLGDGNDVITLLDLLETGAGADTSTKVNIDMGAGDDMVTTGTLLIWSADTKVAGGAGTDTLTLADTSEIQAGTVSGFENLTTGAAAKMTVAQYKTFTGTVTNGGTITFSDTGTVTLNAAGNFTLANGAGNVITVGTDAAGNITGGTGADSFTVKAADVADVVIAGGTGSDTLTVTTLVADTDVTLVGKATGIENITVQGAGGGVDHSITLSDAVVSGAVVVDLSQLTGDGVELVTGAIGTANATSLTVKGTAFADLITNTGVTKAATYHLNNGDEVSDDIATVVDNFHITANASGTTSVKIASSDSTAFDDIITFYNAAGTKVSVQGFVNFDAAFTGGGVVSARAEETVADTTVVKVDMNGDGLFGANDIQVTLVGVGDGSAGEGQALFGITNGAIVVL